MKMLYISVKGKSPLSIFSYLANKIRLNNGDDLIENENVDLSKNILQAELQNTYSLFIIDDCEKDTETVKSIIGLEKYNSKFIFATRELADFRSCNILSYSLAPFTESESQAYLNLNGINLDIIKFNELFEASKGNPLYLYYFSQHQISPLPNDVISYQDSIWSTLNHQEQELLIYITLPYFQIEIQDLMRLYPLESPTQISNKLERLSSLIKNSNGVLDIFHPAFSEHIIHIISANGLKNIYQKKLGEYYISQNYLIQAIYLLIDLNPDRIKEYLLDVFPTIMNMGDLEFGIKVLTQKLNFTSNEIEIGYIHYHLSRIYHLLGDKNLAHISIDIALNLFNKGQNVKMYNAAQMMKAMDLIEDGFVSEGVSIADNIISNVSEDDKLYHAQLLVNISKIYVDTFELRKGAEASKKAYQLFEELQITDGMISSLTNLISCLGQMDEYIDDAYEYGTKLLEFAKKDSNFSVEVIVLNALTSICRQNKNFLEAKKYGEAVVKLCLHLKMKDKVILNLINLGNIIRDEGDIELAIKTYNDALIYAKEYNLKKDIGRIYWIFTSIYRKKGELALSLSFAKKSIEINSEVNFNYGIANAYTEMSKTLLLMDKDIDAAQALENSAIYYKKITHFADSYQTNLSKAINLHFQLGNTDRANKLLSELITSYTEKTNAGKLVELLLQNKDHTNITYNFQLLLNRHFANESSTNIAPQILLYIEYCKNLKNSGKKLFLDILEFLIANLGKVKYSYSMLGIAIEQSGWLIGSEELKIVQYRLQDKLPAFFVRDRETESIIITTINKNINLELLIFNDEPTCAKLMLELVLILSEISEKIFDKTQFVENYCILWINSFSEAYQKIFTESGKSNDPFDKHCQSIHMSKTDWSIQDVIVISNDYEEYCNINKNPENKGTLYFLTNSIGNIKSHLCHTNVMNNKILRTEVMNLVADVLGYNVPSLDTKLNDNEFDIDLKKLKQIV